MRELTRAEAEERMAQYMPAEYVASLLDFWAGAVAAPAPVSDARSITGRPARTFEQWVDEHVSVTPSAE